MVTREMLQGSDILSTRTESRLACRVGFQSLASQPSTTAAETSQKPRSVQFGANRSAASEKGAIGAVPSPRGSGEEAARVMGGSSHQQAHGVREAVGADLWQHIQATIAEQSQEFQRQVGLKCGSVACI